MKAPHFAKPTKSEWKKKAAADLRTEDLAAVIDWHPFKGIHSSAYYDQSDRVADAFSSFFRKLNLGSWQLLAPVEVGADLKTSNQQALLALGQGATGLLFHTNQAVMDSQQLYQDILPEHCLLAFAGSNADVLANDFISTHAPKKIAGFVQDGKKLQRGSSSFKSLGLALSSTFDMIPVLTDYLSDLEKLHHIYGDEFIQYLNVSIKLDHKFYQSIALLRAVRWLTHLFCVSSDIDFQAHELHIAVTINTSGDYKKDLLSNTSAGVAASLGGATSLLFHLMSSKGEQFNSRIARNIGNLMRDEALLSFEKDPVVGSYFLDHLTNDLSEKAWNSYLDL